MSITVAQIAAAIDMSAFHFARAFKQATGETPHAYLLSRRIAATKVLVQIVPRGVVYERTLNAGWASR